MFRRLFWFVSGAVAGVAGVSWVKRRASELREAVTVSSVAGLVRDAAIIASRRIRAAVARSGFLPGRAQVPAVPEQSTVNARPARRHIASRPHNSHR